MLTRRFVPAFALSLALALVAALAAACGGGDKPAGSPDGMDHPQMAMDGGMDHPMTDGGAHH